MLKDNIFMYYFLKVKEQFISLQPYLYQTFYGKQYFVKLLD